ncbi:tyrosine-protein kinase SRK3 isoform X2 [Hyalella azteca]|uniref:Tyrosine-protein kinase n=1 Tax=Hyalella azteca TaxID=294128 RepID=A0A8B7N820_HYAAZ|nr:tyrosine-protein kinase SRK3 isoform X2 [Hyalella azteca]
MGPPLSKLKKKEKRKEENTAIREQTLRKEETQTYDEAAPDDPQGCADTKLDDEPPANGRIRKSLGFVVTIYSYIGRVNTELTFDKGERFEVLDKPNEDWWWMRNLKTNAEGFAFSGYVVPATSLEVQEWYFGDISRKESEKLLLNDPTLLNGTFLVRKSESSSVHSYSLSFKVTAEGKSSVKHHRIYSNDGVYIQNNRKFRTLNDMITFYTSSSSPLKLKQACPKPKPTQWDLSPEMRDEWEIDRRTLVCDEKLGAGNFGEVWHGVWNGTREVAIKTLKPGMMSPEAFLQEASIMKKLRHRNILILYAVCTLEEPILIVTEYMNRGALLDVLRKNGKSLELPDLVDICTQVASAMAHLESKGLIHRDLAARNVLMDSDKHCKVADFGLARIVEHGEYSPNSNVNFPVKWTAPEASLYGQYTIKSDVWSFGIVMMEVLTLGANPYPGMSNNNVMEVVPQGHRMPRPTYPINCPEGLFDVITKCWQYPNIEDRPTFEFLETYLSEWDMSTDINYDEPENAVDQ